MSDDIRLKKLKKNIAAGNVVIIAGTGVSIAACDNQEVDGYKVATWPGLLNHGTHYCKENQLVEEHEAEILTMQIKSGNTDFLILAAEFISKRIMKKSEGTFRGWLEDTIGQLQIKHHAILDALAALPCVIATLNYDNLIEARTGRRAITWQEPDEVQKVLLGENRDAVLHLHGWYHNSESVVLSLSSYYEVRDHPHASTVLQLFAIGKTLLFVGCSDTVLDPNFTRLIEWGQEALKDITPRHYLLCRTSEVAKLQKMLFKAPWLQPLDYGAEYEDLVPFLQTLAPANGTFASTKLHASDRPGFALDAYRQAMLKRYRRLKLEEVDPTTHDILPLTLTGMFIEQSARECAEFMPRVFELPKELQRRLREAGEMEGGEFDEEMLQQQHHAYIEQSPRPILEIVNDPALTRLVILGDPGSGKSTLLQYLLLAWAERVPSDSAREALPLIIELREYARLRREGKADGFLGYLHEGASVRWHFDRNQLSAWLKTNPCVILFDGLDEIFDSVLRRETSTAIHRFADEYPLARVVVTSRIIGYQHQTWSDEHFRHFMLQELDDAQIAGFLAHWHRSAYEDVAKGEAKRALLARAIEDSTAIRELAGNPLLLTMMAILNRTQDLPRDRAELYEQCARLLLHQWKVDLAFAPNPELAKASLDYQDKRNLMFHVARRMQTSVHGLAGNLIDEATLEATLADGLKDVPNLRADRAARALIEHLRGRNFMLCSIGGNSYAFVHRTFLEYFCAAEIHMRFEKEQSLSIEELKTGIFGHWQEETWHEVLCLLAGMIAPRFVGEILEWLLAQPDPNDTCYHVFLAARCVGEVRKRAELGAWEALVRDRTKALVQFDLHYPYRPWSNEELTVLEIRNRAVGTVAMVWSGLSETRAWLKARAQSDEDPYVRRSALEALARGWKDDPETLPMLKARVQSDEDPSVRASAVEALVRGWKDDPETLPWLKARVQSDEDGGVRASALEALARGWKDDPETLPMLKARVQSDEDQSVRASALEALARGWKDDPETLPMLKARAQSDEGVGVCASAVEALARGWKDDPETLPWLKARVQSDEEPYVRRSAVEALARGWKDDPETLPWLKARVQSDEDPSVRASALEALARGWKDDPETLPMLKARAQSDEEPYVRRSAVEALARGWKDDPETLPWLKVRVQSDEDPSVRASALEALVRGWKDDPETLPWLKARAQSDEDSSVRASAVEALARGWKDDPETLPWLKVRVQSDEDGGVRRSAVEALVRGWKDDPETLPWLKARVQSDEDPYVRASALEALARGWKDDPETLPMLKARAQSDEGGGVRASALEALASGWKDDPETLPMLKARVQSNEEPYVRRSALEALARGWKDEPETLPWLKARVQSDEDPSVRASALEALARGWKDDPETLPMLKARVQSDEDGGVRRSAVEALVRGWKDDPETLPMLKARVQSDEDGGVRRSAVEALARGWKDDPETLPMLKARVQSDEEPSVRASAVEALVRGWKDDPETLPMLKARVQSDEDPSVRASAVEALARGWKDDPETLPMLKARVQSDEDPYVRASALEALASGWKDDP
ncbi:NACHT domain-containing protein [Azotobacter chroococcum]|uniref:HEAT repeat domain-containing protein n=1 Tax=Azotobacter chroococcum TaxID=353 RepID=UPI00103AFF7E|nr:HEAT repeat domain-containing protein [Azotobacter chroococcum]TBW08487.1 NACHT domain-containing protein [Azotobacter chroococcum]